MTMAFALAKASFLVELWVVWLCQIAARLFAAKTTKHKV